MPPTRPTLKDILTLKDMGPKSDMSAIRFSYTPALRNFESLFSYLYNLKDEDFVFTLKGKEIEVYENNVFLGSIRDQGGSYLVPQRVLKTPLLNFQIRRMRL